MDKKRYWIIIACNDEGYWFLNRFHYSEDDLYWALKEGAKFASGEFKCTDPKAMITVTQSSL